MVTKPFEYTQQISLAIFDTVCRQYAQQNLTTPKDQNLLVSVLTTWKKNGLKATMNVKCGLKLRSVLYMKWFIVFSPLCVCFSTSGTEQFQIFLYYIKAVSWVWCILCETFWSHHTLEEPVVQSELQPCEYTLFFFSHVLLYTLLLFVCLHCAICSFMKRCGSLSSFIWFLLLVVGQKQI